MLHDNPRAYYEAAIAGPTAGDDMLGKYHIDHRFPLVINLAVQTVKQFLHTDQMRQYAREWFFLDWGGRYLPLVEYLLEKVPAAPAEIPYPRDKFTIQEFGMVMTILPSTVFARYQWADGEYQDWVDFLCTLDHASSCSECSPPRGW
jgi:hypothetical protein